MKRKDKLRAKMADVVREKQAAGELSRFASIDELLVVFDDMGVWPDEWLGGAVAKAKKDEIRDKIEAMISRLDAIRTE